MQRIHRWTTVFAAIAIAWAVALPLAALVKARPSAPAIGHVVSAAVYTAGAVVCHQKGERSFSVGGVALPVCARCTGIYIAAAAATAILLAGSTRRRPSNSPQLSLRHIRALACMSVVPTALTVMYEWSSGRAPSNVVRALAGMPVGLLVAWLVMRSARPHAHSE